MSESHTVLGRAAPWLLAAGLGLAWVPESVRQFQRPGVVYRALDKPGRGGKSGKPGKGLEVPGCETSLVWREGGVNPSLERFIGFVRDQPGDDAGLV